MNKTPLLTGPELMREWDYRYEERLGMLCGSLEPTPAQKRLAREDANEFVVRYRKATEPTDSAAVPHP